MAIQYIPNNRKGAELDWKGLTSFLLITFSITWAVEAVFIRMGLRFSMGFSMAGDFSPGGVPAFLATVVVGMVMWVPALATVLTVKFVTREGFGIAQFRFGPWKPYLISALVVPACFIVTYGLTWALGLGKPDWRLAQFRANMAANGADTSTMPPIPLLLAGIFAAGMIMGPTINGLFAFGEELGWRGYLLPKLMPLGKPKAYIVVGLVWGLWHAPLIFAGFNYPGYPILGALGMMGLTTALSVYINELTLRNRSSILAGWIHGAFNGQAYGIWRLLFPGVNPLLGGFTGSAGLAVWLAVGLRETRRGGGGTKVRRG